MTEETPEVSAEIGDSSKVPAGDGSSDSANVQIFLRLPEGTRLRVTLETLPDSKGEDQPDRKVRLNQEGQSETGTLSVNLPVPRPGEIISEEVTIPLGSTAAPAPDEKTPAVAGRAKSLPARLRAGWWTLTHSLQLTLFGLALLVYLSTRLIGLVDFPIYFFTDEAVQTVLAADLVRDHFQDYDKILLPTYFKNGTQYNLSTSVYLQVIPYLLFGKSEFVTRATSVLVTLLAAVCIGLILKDFFEIPYWWVGTLLLSITPAWFLHSRTAFETVIFVSLYAAMLYSYLLYRCRSPRYLYLTLLLAALAFYSYSPAQMIVAVTGLLLFISDIRYHWQNRGTVSRGLGLAVLLALPYLRFRFTHPTAMADHLRNLYSYWIQPLPLGEKLSQFAAQYLFGLSPAYWFLPNDADLSRHLMKGYGNLLLVTLPFVILGLALALRWFRSPERGPASRAVLIALLAAPSGAALAQIGITRALVFVIPANLLAALGLSWSLVWLERRKLSRRWLSIGLFAVLALFNIAMLRDALVNGPTWYSDYGLGGMQYGARQLFGAVKEYLQEFPDTHMIVSPTWSNGTDVVARFFFPDPLPFQLASIQGHIDQHLPLDNHTLFVLTPDEFNQAISSNKFTDIRIQRTVPYPDGRPGFYFVNLSYVANIDQILNSERQARRQLLSAEILWNGQTVQVKYPHLDMGQVENAFDGDPNTLMRTLEANPAVLEIQFSQPVEVGGLYLKFGSTEAKLLVRLFPADGSRPLEYQAMLNGSVEKPDGVLEFPAPVLTQSIHLEVGDTRQQEPGHVHIWEIGLR